MHVISRTRLIDFWTKHPESETPLKVWFKKVKQAQWKGINELKKDFPTADYVGNDRVVFDIKGNKYRLIVLVFFMGQKVFIRFVGTMQNTIRLMQKTPEAHTLILQLI